MSIAPLLIGLGALIFGAYLFSTLFEKTNIPDVLPLFLIGLIIGPATGWITPEMLGGTGQLIATLTLISILFVGGLNINISSLISSFSKTFLLMFLNLLGSIVVIAAGAYYLFDVPLIAGTIVGILLGGTSSAVVIPIANQLNLREETRTILSIESDLNDIFSVTVALALVGIMQQQNVVLADLPLDIISVFLISVTVGVVLALIWSRLLGRARLLDHNIFTTPALLLIVYGIAELTDGIGAVTILAFGITLGNLASIKHAPFKSLAALTSFRLTSQERSFFSSLVFLFKTFFFVYIGIVIPLNEPVFLLWGAGIMGILYLLRIVFVNMLLKNDLRTYDLTIVKSMLPKGLTGGALLVLIGDPLLEKLTYPVILMSIVFTAVIVVIADISTASPEESSPSRAGTNEQHLPPRLLPAPEKPINADVERYTIGTSPPASEPDPNAVR